MYYSGVRKENIMDTLSMILEIVQENQDIIKDMKLTIFIIWGFVAVWYLFLIFIISKK